MCWIPSEDYPPDDFMGRDPSPYDLDGDCWIDISDLNLLTGLWLQNASACDFDGNSRVDLGDLAEIAGDWLECGWIPADLNCL
jgi:hypothetical protein